MPNICVKPNQNFDEKINKCCLDLLETFDRTLLSLIGTMKQLATGKLEVVHLT